MMIALVHPFDSLPRSSTTLPPPIPSRPTLAITKSIIEFVNTFAPASPRCSGSHLPPPTSSRPISSPPSSFYCYPSQRLDDLIDVVAPRSLPPSEADRLPHSPRSLLFQTSPLHVRNARQLSSVNQSSAPPSPIPYNKGRRLPYRLIDARTTKLKEFSSEHTPPYAILSHTWSHEKEVTFQELANLSDVTKTKSGYKKILAACRQAQQDGLDYIWIDTCCIDQANDHEVAQDINSMYAYYKNAEVCYAYLADLRKRGKPWGEDPFRGCKWFRRGWTLQELLAPRKVVFFDAKWYPIGDKCELRHEIHSLTGISPDVLEAKKSVHIVDVLERMSWCAGRKTARPPDLAYCLQGIMGVCMTPDYTETVVTAFERLHAKLAERHPSIVKTYKDGNDLYQRLIRRNVRSRLGIPADGIIHGQTNVTPLLLSCTALPRVGSPPPRPWRRSPPPSTFTLPFPDSSHLPQTPTSPSPYGYHIPKFAAPSPCVPSAPSFIKSAVYKPPTPVLLTQSPQLKITTPYSRSPRTRLKDLLSQSTDGRYSPRRVRTQSLTSRTASPSRVRARSCSRDCDLPGFMSDIARCKGSESESNLSSKSFPHSSGEQVHERHKLFFVVDEQEGGSLGRMGETGRRSRRSMRRGMVRVPTQVKE